MACAAQAGGGGGGGGRGGRDGSGLGLEWQSFSNLDSFNHFVPLGPIPVHVHRSTFYGWVPRFCSKRALPFSVRQCGTKANDSPVCRTGASIVTIFISRSDVVLPVMPRTAVGWAEGYA